MSDLLTDNSEMTDAELDAEIARLKAEIALSKEEPVVEDLVVEEPPAVDMATIPVVGETPISDMTVEQQDAEIERLSAEVGSPSTEIDTFSLQAQRENNEISDTDLVTKIISQAGGVLLLDGQPIYLENAVEEGNNPTKILDFLLKGAPAVNTEIDSNMDAVAAGVNTGWTNIVGMAGDLGDAAFTGIEGLFRKGANTLAGFNAPEGVDDPSSPNYNPDFYLSTDPKDYVLTNPEGNAISGRGVRRTLNGLHSMLGMKEPYIDSKYQVPEEFRPAFVATEVVTENASLAIPLLATARLGVGIANPLMKSIQNAPGTFVKQEIAATAAQSAAVVGLEKADIQNPWIRMGVEFAAAAGGAVVATPRLPNASRNTDEIIKRLTKAASLGKDKVLTNIPGFSGPATTRLAITELLTVAANTRTSLLAEADARKLAGDVEIAGRLTLYAESFTAERIVADIENGLAAAQTPAAAGLPAGSISENAFLDQMQNTLTSQSSEFATQINKSTQAALNEMSFLADILARSGNLNMAQAMRSRYYQQTINTEIAEAQNVAKAEIESLVRTDTKQASIRAQEILLEAKTRMRSMETFFWDRVDRNISVDSSEVAEAMRAAKQRFSAGASVGQGTQVDAVIDIFLKEVGDGTKSTTSGRLLTLRTDLLEYSAKFAADNSFRSSSALDEIASAAIDELKKDKYLDFAKGDVLTEARLFTTALNNRFTRSESFVSKAVSKDSTRGFTIRPENTLDEALAPQGTVAELNLSSMRETASEADAAASVVTDKQMNDLRLKEAQENVAAQDAPPEPGPKPNVATNEGLLYPENTSYPINPVVGDGFTTNSGSVVFPPDGRRNSPQTFADDVVDADGNPIPRDELPDGVSDGEKLDTMFNRPGTNSQEPPIVDDFDAGTIPGTSGATPDMQGPFPKVLLGDEITKAQEDFLRAKIGSFTSQDGLLDVEKVNRFIKANPWLEKDFPDFMSQVSRVQEASINAIGLATRYGDIGTTGRLPKSIGQAIDSSNPVEAYTALAARAKGDPIAIADLRSATMDMLIDRAGPMKSPDGTESGIDFIKLTRELGAPLSGRKFVEGSDALTPDSSILDVLLDTKVLSPDEVEAILEVVGTGLQLQRNQLGVARFDQVMGQNPGIVDNLARVAGANFGAMFGFGGGAQLQAAAIGSGFVKNLISGGPQNKAINKLNLMFKTPTELVAAIKANPKIQSTAADTAREFYIKYGGMDAAQMRQAAAAAAADVGMRITSATTVRSISLFNSLSQEGFVTTYIPTLEAQMEDLEETISPMEITIERDSYVNPRPSQVQ